METKSLKISVETSYWFLWQPKCAHLCLAQSQFWQGHQGSSVPKSNQWTLNYSLFHLMLIRNQNRSFRGELLRGLLRTAKHRPRFTNRWGSCGVRKGRHKMFTPSSHSDWWRVSLRVLSWVFLHCSLVFLSSVLTVTTVLFVPQLR